MSYPKFYVSSIGDTVVKMFDPCYGVTICSERLDSVGIYEEMKTIELDDFWLEVKGYEESEPIFHDNRNIGAKHTIGSNGQKVYHSKKQQGYGEIKLDDSKSIQEDRQDDYGDVSSSHDAIATMWETYINRNPTNKVTLSRLDVAIMMVLFKACREGYKHKFDNVLDLASYSDIALGFCTDLESRKATENER